MEMVPLSADAGLGDVVERINQNTAAIEAGLQDLQRIADSYAKALPESVADRKALHEQLDAARREASAAAAAATSASSAASSAGSMAGAAATRAAEAAAAAGDAAMKVAALVARQPRAATATVPALTNVLTTAAVDVKLTWPTPWPDITYSVMPVVEVPASLLGRVTVAVKTKTKEDVTVTVTASAVLAAGAVTVRAVSVP